MASTEGIIGGPLKEKTAKKGFIHSAKAKIAATGLGIALIGGFGVAATAQNEKPQPQPTPIAGGVGETTKPTKTPVVTPTELQTSSPTEAIIPSWVKEIPPPKWPINEVPLNGITKKAGRFVEYPKPDGSGFLLTTQNATIVAVEPDPKNGAVWVAMALEENKLTKAKGTGYINGGKDYYNFKGLTIWYEFDSNTTILKKNPAGSQTDSTALGTGLEYVAGHLKVGDTLFGITSSLDEGTVDQPELNKTTLNEIENSIGRQNIRDDKKFEMYGAIVFLP